MPAIFTEEQKDELRRSIKQNALKRFEEKGIRKTTVSELAASVGIAKGTFYNFYSSKGELAADILRDFDRISEAKLREQLQKNGRIHIDKLFDVYMNIFSPETAFSFHFTPDDISWMQETEETRIFFDPEYGIKTAKLLLDNVDGIRSDVDYAYIVNCAKLINIAIENRDSFCKSAFQDNLDSIMKIMADHLRG
jgi:AcrR family transcriptional regulator